MSQSVHVADDALCFIYYVLKLFLHTVEVLLEEFEASFPVIPLQPYPSWKANASHTNYTCDMLPGGNRSKITWNKINFVRFLFTCFFSYHKLFSLIFFLIVFK